MYKWSSSPQPVSNGENSVSHLRLVLWECPNHYKTSRLGFLNKPQRETLNKKPASSDNPGIKRPGWAGSTAEQLPAITQSSRYQFLPCLDKVINAVITCMLAFWMLLSCAGTLQTQSWPGQVGATAEDRIHSIKKAIIAGSGRKVGINMIVNWY